MRNASCSAGDGEVEKLLNNVVDVWHLHRDTVSIRPPEPRYLYE